MLGGSVCACKVPVDVYLVPEAMNNHYDQSRDSIMSHLHHGCQIKKITSLITGHLTFVSLGYCNWKDATGEKGAFHTHHKSATN